MADPHLVDIVRNSPESWNAWRWKHWDHEADLTNIDLSGKKFPRKMEFRKTDFSGSNLASASVTSANFYEAKFVGTNLSHLDAVHSSFSSCNASHADFTSSYLLETDFSRANLSNATLVGVRMSHSKFWGANLCQADLTDSDMEWVDMMDADLGGAKLIRTNLALTRFLRANLCGATLKECNVHGSSVWRVKTDLQTTQNGLIITDQVEGEPVVTVDDLEVCQFIYLILNNTKIRNVINTITSKGVLILGRFTPTRKPVLDAIKVALRSKNYLPILFDFDKPSRRDITETVSTLAHMARFVIADLTDAKSIPQELTSIVPNLPSVPVQPILLSTEPEYSMFEHFRRFPWVLEPYLYENSEALARELQERVIAPAEQMICTSTPGTET